MKICVHAKMRSTNKVAEDEQTTQQLNVKMNQITIKLRDQSRVRQEMLSRINFIQRHAELIVGQNNLKFIMTNAIEQMLPMANAIIADTSFIREPVE